MKLGHRAAFDEPPVFNAPKLPAPYADLTSLRFVESPVTSTGLLSSRLQGRQRVPTAHDVLRTDRVGLLITGLGDRVSDAELSLSGRRIIVRDPNLQQPVCDACDPQHHVKRIPEPMPVERKIGKRKIHEPRPDCSDDAFPLAPKRQCRTLPDHVSDLLRDPLRRPHPMNRRIVPAMTRATIDPTIDRCWTFVASSRRFSSNAWAGFVFFGLVSCVAIS